MAVDVKTLTIGSHVEYKGKRGRILYVAPGGGFMNCGIRTTDDCGLPANYHISGFEQIHPIPITPDLLKELGFKWRKDSSCWRKKVGKDYWIFANGMDEVGWQFLLFPPYEKIRKQATLYADNLHEIEGQLAYYGIELKE